MENNGSADSRDMLYLVGGLAFLIAGAGLIMAHPGIQRELRARLSRVLPDVGGNLTASLTTVVPDFERYMKIRSM